jgi:hypothetical protein
MSSPPWRDFPGAHNGLCNIPELESFDSGRTKPGLGQGFVSSFECMYLKMLDAGFWMLDEETNPFFVYPASSI